MALPLYKPVFCLYTSSSLRINPDFVKQTETIDNPPRAMRAHLHFPTNTDKKGKKKNHFSFRKVSDKKFVYSVHCVHTLICIYVGFQLCFFVPCSGSHLYSALTNSPSRSQCCAHYILS